MYHRYTTFETVVHIVSLLLLACFVPFCLSAQFATSWLAQHT